LETGEKKRELQLPDGQRVSRAFSKFQRHRLAKTIFFSRRTKVNLRKIAAIHQHLPSVAKVLLRRAIEDLSRADTSENDPHFLTTEFENGI